MLSRPYKKLVEQPPTYPMEMQRALSPPAISVQQTRRGWCQECFGCEAKSEYKVYAGHLEEGQARDQNIPQLGHLLEESPCILRCCCSASRPFTMPFTSGAEGQGAKVLEFRKGWSLPICCLIPAGEGDPCQCPCCCCLPALETYAADGSLVGSTAYLCDAKLFVPKFVVRDHRGADKFLIRPDTCCCDCCVVIRCDLGGRRRASRIMYTPFFIRDPLSGARLGGALGGDAHISKVWSGFKKECCTDADNFQATFPSPSHLAARSWPAQLLCVCAYIAGGLPRAGRHPRPRQPARRHRPARLLLFRDAESGLARQRWDPFRLQIVFRLTTFPSYPSLAIHGLRQTTARDGGAPRPC